MQQHSQWCPPGQVLCCLCFGCFTKDQLDPEKRDENGVVVSWWDVCLTCRAEELETIKRKKDSSTEKNERRR